MLRMKLISRLTGAALAIALTVPIAAAQQPSLTRDLTFEQKPLYDLDAPKSDLAVTAWVDREETNTYRPGESLQLFVKPNQDAYITVVDVGTSGKVHILFPNKFQRDNRVFAHQVLEIPGPDSSWRIKVGGPTGQELIKVIATTRPDQVVDITKLDDLGPVYRSRDTAQAFTRDLSIVLEKHRGNSAVFNKVIRIMPEKTGSLGPTSSPRRQSGAAQSETPVRSVVSPEDLFKLGEAHFYGDGGRANHREALRYLTAAADGGHVGAMHFIGRIHEAGQDVDASPAHAMTWYRKAADLGNTQAMVRLAMIHSSRDGQHRDLGQTVSWLRKAAGQGDSMAMIHLAKMHDDGIGIDRAPKEAAKFLLTALKGGAWTVIEQVSKFSEDTRREVQAALTKAGHYRGPVEGRIGAETRAAMVEWARAG